MMQYNWDFNKFFEVSFDLLTISDIVTGKYIKISPSIKRILGYTIEEVLGKTLWDFVHPEDLEALTAERDNAFMGHSVTNLELRCLCKDKNYKWIEWNSVPVQEDGVFYTIGRDITPRKYIERYADIHTKRLSQVIALQQELASQSLELNLAFPLIAQRINKIMESVGVLILLKEEGKIIIKYADGPKLFVGQNLADDSFCVEVLKKMRVVFEANIQQKAMFSYSREEKDLFNNLNIRSLIMVPINDSEIPLILFIYHTEPNFFSNQDLIMLQLLASEVSAKIYRAINIKNKEQLVDKLYYQANHDPLTELPNRAFFNKALEEMLLDKRRKSGAVMLMDLNKFKEVNDTLGHPVGDLLLKEVARRIKTCLRSEDIVARLGGDEFAFVLKDIDAYPMTKARQLLSLLEVVFTIDGKELYISASIGIALFPEHSINKDELVRLADKAMYKAKQNNTGYCIAKES